MLLLLLCLRASSAEETALLTGGFNGLEGARDGCSLLDLNPPSCSVPDLPWSAGTNRSGRSDLVTFATEDGLVLTCGGESATGEDDLSCVSLDLTASLATEQAWVHHSMLDVDRVMATAVTLPGRGSYILGGFKRITSSFLPLGSAEWEEGPTLPGVDNPDELSYYGMCSVLLSDTQFLAIGGNAEGFLGGTRVAEFDGDRGTLESWPSLVTERWGHACAKVGDTVVVAAGVSQFFTILDSTTVLDLTTGEEREGGRMSHPRAWLGMATVEGTVLGFGGNGGFLKGQDTWDTIEEWDMVAEEWTNREERMATDMHGFAAITVQKEDFCGVF